MIDVSTIPVQNLMDAAPSLPPCATLLDGLSSDAASELARALRITRLLRGDFVFHVGEPALSLYIVYEGVIKKAYSNASGDEQILGLFQKGEIFGHLFLGKYTHRIATALAITDAIVASLSRVELERLIETHPRIGLNLLRYYADEQRETLARIHAIRQANAHYRLLGTLLTLARRAPCETNVSDWVSLPPGITQADIASLAGLNRSTASLLINALRREGVLGGSGRHLTVHRAQVEYMLNAAGFEILE